MKRSKAICFMISYQVGIALLAPSNGLGTVLVTALAAMIFYCGLIIKDDEPKCKCG